jgi:hypothetical protein
MSDDLGSLAQSARGKQLKSAKTWIFAIGILTLLANIGMSFVVGSQVDEEVKKLQAQNQVVDQQAVEAAKREAQLVCAGFAAIGVVFIVMGFFVNAYPVPITILALVLYLAGFAISAVLDPTTIVQGIILKIIIIAGLSRSIKAALAYERERAAAAQAPGTLLPDAPA